jgi:anti-sigma factor RsiW
MDCTKARELFAEHIDGELKGSAKDALESHLVSCANCAGVFKGLVEAASAARSAPRFRAPEGFALRVMDEIRSLDEETPFLSWLWSMPPYLKLAQAAAAAAVVFIGVYSAGFLSGKLNAPPVAGSNGEASLVASVSAEYLDPVPPDSMGEMYLSIEENGNEQ